MENGSSNTGYSPEVRLRLEVAGKVIALAQVAPEWVIPKTPFNVPPMEAVVSVSIDGREHRRSVVLTEGMSTSSTFVPVRDQLVQQAKTIVG